MASCLSRHLAGACAGTQKDTHPSISLVKGPLFVHGSPRSGPVHWPVLSEAPSFTAAPALVTGLLPADSTVDLGTAVRSDNPACLDPRCSPISWGSGQQACEKVLDVTDHQGNANTVGNEISPYNC